MPTLAFSGLSAEVLGHELVVLCVGPTQTIFSIYKRLICEKSTFFHRALNQHIDESATGLLELPQFTENALNPFINWLYTGQTPDFVKLAEATLSKFPGETCMDRHAREFFNSKVFPIIQLAEELGINPLMNKTMDSLQDFLSRFRMVLDETDYRTIYEINSSTNSKARLFCAASFARYINKQTAVLAKVQVDRFVDSNHFYPEIIKNSFAFQIVHGSKLFPKVLDNRSRSNDDAHGSCFFHTHLEGEECHLLTSH